MFLSAVVQNVCVHAHTCSYPCIFTSAMMKTSGGMSTFLHTNVVHWPACHECCKSTRYFCLI